MKSETEPKSEYGGNVVNISTIEIKLASRYDEFDPEQDGNKNTKFADIIIDGKSLYQRLK